MELLIIHQSAVFLHSQILRSTKKADGIWIAAALYLFWQRNELYERMNYKKSKIYVVAEDCWY